jgi:hypothetical protein
MADSDHSSPTQEEIGEALQARLTACPLCGGQTWRSDGVPVALPTIQRDPDGRAKIVRQDDADGRSFNSVAAFAAACDDCGYMVFFHLDSFLGRASQAAE